MSLDELVHDTYTHLFDIEPLALTDGETAVMLNKMTSKMMDSQTYQALEIENLFNAMDYAQTWAGKACLFRSLVQPLESLELIRAKQDSLRELERDSKLRGQLQSYIESLATDE